MADTNTPITNTVTITIEEYFDLRHKAGENYWLMNELGNLRGKFEEVYNRLNDLENELWKVKKDG